MKDLTTRTNVPLAKLTAFLRAHTAKQRGLGLLVTWEHGNGV